MVKYFFIFFLGAIFGSFLNVCVYRLPRKLSIVFPFSHCPICSLPIRFFDNIPLISYILLLGKCRNCRAVINIRYFLLEFISGSTALAIYAAFHTPHQIVLYGILAALLLLASFIDLEHGIIPDSISVTGIVLGLILTPFFSYETIEFSKNIFLNSFIGVFAGILSVYGMGLLGEIFFKKDGVGGGDIKLMGMIGAFIGWKLVILTFFLAPFFAMPFALTAKIKYKKETIPYGPYLALAGFISLLFGNKIIEYLL
ncbi:peptidase A24A domain-containing protein [Candidatus Omnitrophus magneticus]|uniref:Prepilin leader peptidase/N-methyltransferase n=1 Tax=Candidatus Omnitrophus magneticus TaxID=1609969 RepID=A0A0F0CQ04_9BACT|nr:peptidase A24A domain-containing protein [Candidatus Omnitrophus magneticus]